MNAAQLFVSVWKARASKSSSASRRRTSRSWTLCSIPSPFVTHATSRPRGYSRRLLTAHRQRRRVPLDAWPQRPQRNHQRGRRQPMDHAPLVAIADQAATTRLHWESHRVLDLVKIFEPITKYATRILEGEVVPEITRKAFKLAQLEKPGACFISFPENIAAMAPTGGRSRCQSVAIQAGRRRPRQIRRRDHRRRALSGHHGRQRCGAYAQQPGAGVRFAGHSTSSGPPPSWPKV